jgi:hypothetical protein
MSKRTVRTRTLRLASETLRTLTPGDLRGVGGGTQLAVVTAGCPVQTWRTCPGGN